MASTWPVRPTRNALSVQDWSPLQSGRTLDPGGMLSRLAITFTQHQSVGTPVRIASLAERIIFEGLQQLKKLEEGWDAYGAPPIEERALRRTADLLRKVVTEWAPLPDLMPSTDGGVIVEWYRPRRRLRITIPPEDTPTLFYRDEAGIWEGPLDENAPDLRTLLDRIS